MKGFYLKVPIKEKKTAGGKLMKFFARLVHLRYLQIV